MLGWVFPVQIQAKENVELSKIAENVYARIVTPDGDAVGNAGVVILSHSVLVFDTHFTPEAGQALLSAIRALTTKPVLYVVNSHAHADHTHGNQVFEGAQLIGSSAARRDVLEVDLPSLNRSMGFAQSQLEKLRRDMSKETDTLQLQRMREQIKNREDYIQTMSRLKIKAPFVTVDDSLIIQDGKDEVRILYLGKGHTDGDLVVFLPVQKIAFVGDLFFNEAIPNVQDASLLLWATTLEAVLKLEADKFVPGHGAVGSRKDVEEFLGYFTELRSLVKEAVDRGDTMEQVTKDLEVPAKFSSYRFQNFFPANVQKMYAELKALQISTSPAEGTPKTKRSNAK
jgi:glyoxylase-like metal-dependent hydrolase (beta-lactamase superfamily II)